MGDGRKGGSGVILAGTMVNSLVWMYEKLGFKDVLHLILLSG